MWNSVGIIACFAKINKLIIGAALIACFLCCGIIFNDVGSKEAAGSTDSAHIGVGACQALPDEGQRAEFASWVCLWDSMLEANNEPRLTSPYAWLVTQNLLHYLLLCKEKSDGAVSISLLRDSFLSRLKSLAFPEAFGNIVLPEPECARHQGLCPDSFDYWGDRPLEPIVQTVLNVGAFSYPDNWFPGNLRVTFSADDGWQKCEERPDWLSGQNWSIEFHKANRSSGALAISSDFSVSVYWADMFLDSDTQEGDFFFLSRPDRSTGVRQVEFMRKPGQFSHYSDQKFTAISLDVHRCPDLKFIAVMNNSPATMPDYWRELFSFDVFFGLIDRLESDRLECEANSVRRALYFPKFDHMACTKLDVTPFAYQFLDKLVDIGGRTPVYFDESAHVCVSESGISFKAEHDLMVVGRSNLVVKFDRPFLYYLMNIKSRVIFLIGEYLGPS